MQRNTTVVRQVVDLSAMLRAAILGGLAFLLIQAILFPLVTGNSLWAMIRMMAAIVLGESILAPPTEFSSLALVTALFIHFAVSLLFATVLTFILHRWGIIIGFFGGALFGLGLYFITFHLLADFFPWFAALRGWTAIFAHVLYGALTGFLYELWEEEQYVIVEEANAI